MRSEITQRIIDETPERVKDEVKEYAKNRIRMNDKERKIHVLEMVLELCWPRLLPEELADLRSLLEDLKRAQERWQEAIKNRGFIDWNNLNIEESIGHLENEFGPQSSGTAKCVFELIAAYRKLDEEKAFDKAFPPSKN